MRYIKYGIESGKNCVNKKNGYNEKSSLYV